MTRITVGPEPAHASGKADYFDGETAAVQRVTVALDKTGALPGFILFAGGLPLARWPFDQIVEIPDQARGDEVIVGLRNDPLRRLVIHDVYLRLALETHCPNRKKRPAAKGKSRLLGWAAAAIAAVGVIIFVMVPFMADRLATFLPPKGEQALGDATFEQIRSALGENDLIPLRICEAPAGVAALNRIKARLSDGLDLPYPIQVSVVNHPMVNAFALPGGRVVFFRGLIDQAESADEVAAVFAHEIGHVLHRDPTRIALRSAGTIGVLGMVLGDFAGGFLVLFLTDRLIQADYSRVAEADADSFAHETLASNGIPPSALAALFERLKARNGAHQGIAAHFSSHPELGDRIAAARAADIALTGAIRPVLSDLDWQALRKICQ